MTNKEMKPTTLTGTPELVHSGFDQPPANPLHLFQQWLETADQLKINEPRGLVLSTINSSGAPSSRVVFLRVVDDKGMIFASSETSQKGRDLSINPRASGTLWWRETLQQINFCGFAHKMPTSVSDEFFRQRTREAQAVAAVSSQSAPMANEDVLRSAMVKLADQSTEIRRPETWHAYHIAIETIEFWHGSRDRFHHRLRYDLKDGIWHHQKLQP